MSQIHILDGQSNQGEILDYITAKNIISDNHKKSKEDTLETYDFITFADKRFSEFLEKRNRIIIPDEDDTLREFVIFEAGRYRDSEGYKSQVYSHASYLELKKATVLYPDSYKGTASQHAGRTLNDTGWQVGIVEVSGDKTLSRDKHTNPYEFLKRIAKEFEAELRFRIEHDGNKVIGRYVDLLQRVGAWRGREVEFGKDLDGIRRVEEQDIVTALLGLGPEREDGSRLEVLVEDEDALKRWGRVDEYGNLHHLIEPYEIQSERSEMNETEARRYTRTALNKRINTQVTYEGSIVDLENVPGMENKKIRFGDTIRIKDTKFNPPLYLEARIFEQTRSIKSKAKKDIKLGDFIEYSEEEVNAIWIMLQREIRKKIDVEMLREYAEPKKIESDTPPDIKEGENPIWVDTSKTPKVSNVAIAGEWQKMIPTTPEEVDAYTKQQVDNKAREEAEEKAKQALKNAEAFAKNAENISEGVIDVGTVPLRTSITGARLEWDGVNGLVQYNRDGEETSWLNLEGEAYFTNGFFSGRIEADEGYFKGALEGATGTFEGYINTPTLYIENPNAEQEGESTIKLQLTMDNQGGGSTPYDIQGYTRFYSHMGGLSIDKENLKGDIVPLDSLMLNSNVLQVTGQLQIGAGGLSGSDYGIAFPSYHSIGISPREDAFTVWGNRANGRLPFLIRSHENINSSSYRNDFWISSQGTIYTPPTFDNTSTHPATLRVGTASGHVTRSTSAKKSKILIEPIKVDPYKILTIEPRDWYDKGDSERLCEAMTKKTNGERYSLDDVESIRRVGGLVAEEVENAGLEMYVDYDEEGEITNVHYDRLWTLLIPVVRDLKNELEELKNGTER